MDSRSEALAILKEWFDNGSVLDCWVISSVPAVDPQGEMKRMAKTFFGAKIVSLADDRVTLVTADGKQPTFGLSPRLDFWSSDADAIDPLPLQPGLYGKRVQWEITSLTLVLMANRVK
jgi:hypothetical protein